MSSNIKENWLTLLYPAQPWLLYKGEKNKDIFKYARFQNVHVPFLRKLLEAMTHLQEQMKYEEKEFKK